MGRRLSWGRSADSPVFTWGGGGGGGAAGHPIIRLQSNSRSYSTVKKGLVSDIPVGDGKIAPFLQCIEVTIFNFLKRTLSEN